MNGIEIKSGDTIGIIGKEIVVDEPKRFDAALALAEKLLEGERFMLTIFCGIDAGADECAMLEEKIIEQNPGIEVYMIDAGQDVYPYIFVAK